MQKSLKAKHKSRLGSSIQKVLLPRHSFDQAPLRSALLNAEQMRKHGASLASGHVFYSGSVIDNLLLSRLARNEAVLLEVRELLGAALAVNRRITPAAEWLLDNFYLIEEQIHTSKRHLPRNYSRELPRLRTGSSHGLPRVYDIALETISHGDGRVDSENLESFVAAYQTISILNLGELWAIPIMLRLSLIENLRRVASLIAKDMAERSRADQWADRMMETAENSKKSLILVVAEMVKSDPPLQSAFVAEMARRLQGQSANLALPLNWIEQRLSETGLSIKHLVQVEVQQQAANQVSMSNSIASLRFLGASNWHDFVEDMSPVNQTLATDPSGFFVQMDFATRDRYRHVIEKTARSSTQSELEVAQESIRLSLAATETHGVEDRRAHVGYYLIDKGRPLLEAKVDMQRNLSRRLQGLIRRFPLVIYSGAITVLNVLFAGLLSPFTAGSVFEGWTWLILMIFLGLVFTQLSLAVVNRLAMFRLSPHPLPRLDFSKGIPKQSRSLVVIPTMLIDNADTSEMVELLEIRFLANQDEQLYFCLLTDFLDNDSQTCPDDPILLSFAQNLIKDLNKKYAGKTDRFFLFHRPRLWNEREKKWMGYERKRGKLADLNAFILGGDAKAFELIVGDTSAILGLRYIITLDSDTQLPRDSAHKLVAAMSHPLNQAVFDKKKGRVVEGYGILQPRMTEILQGSNRSRYAQLSGGEPGMDPYTRTVSDVYQDLFAEGSFTGKGIYDIAIFEEAMSEKIPENLVLSHDLLEGAYVRSGLLSDVQLLEEHPSRFEADVKRRKRWIRGDWQILGWVLPLVRDAKHKLIKNPLSGLSQWKILDNLRRSLMPIGQLLLLVIGWTLLKPVWLWTLAVLAISVLPALIDGTLETIRKSIDVLWRQHAIVVGKSMIKRLANLTFALAILPYEAYYSLLSLLKSLWRMMVSHTRLLEWNTAASARISKNNSLLDSIKKMGVASLFSGLLTGVLAFLAPLSLLVASPFLLAWFASPFITWQASRPIVRKRVDLDDQQRLYLRRLARKIWGFFETFVGEEDNWLPPDNVQEHPVRTVAHRTSPTNIGFSLLNNLSAYDFGYQTLLDCQERCKKTLQTMAGLERYRGHFYNWYDTQSLRPLNPRYVSTVDSGNLAGYLLVLKSGLKSAADDPIVAPRFFEGMADSLALIEFAPSPITVDLHKRLEKLLSSFSSTLSGKVSNGQSTQPTLSLAQLYQAMTDVVHACTSLNTQMQGSEQNLRAGVAAMLGQAERALEQLQFFAPWCSEPAEALALSGLNNVPSLRQLAQTLGQTILRAQGIDDAGRLGEMLANSAEKASLRLEELEELAQTAGDFATMEYGFLYDGGRKLFSIGYNVDQRRCDAGSYDLLASEARLASFVAIAQGGIGQENWFALGRQLTSVGTCSVLLSWSGSMFEYLMPLLLMPNYDHSLLDQTYSSCVKRQIEYGKLRGIPWGVSESGYYLIDAAQNYQYRAFGIPGLGLKRGLADDLVIAPYASTMALMVDAKAACDNLERMTDEGFEGEFGFYEAVDYTTGRLLHGESKAIVKSFMAHHQGMSLLALSYVLHGQPMQKRFVAEPMFAATTLLLQERMPKDMVMYSHASESAEIKLNYNKPDLPVRLFSNADSTTPEVQLLSNGSYHVMLTNSGAGYSRWNEMALTRWREDTTADNWGSFAYVRDLGTGQFWSLGFQPTLKKPRSYEVIFSEGRAEIMRSDFGLDCHTTVLVSPDDDIELRRTKINNRSRVRREIEITSYAELVLSPIGVDAQHPAFGNLFVQTELDSVRHALLGHRRPRSKDEKSPWFFQQMNLYGADAQSISYETDRARFIGRGRSPANPLAMQGHEPLSGTVGPVLDPVVAIRYKIVLEPDQVATIDIIQGIAATRNGASNLIGKYQDQRMADRVFDLSWSHSHVVLRQLNVSVIEAQLYCQLAAAVIFANGKLRADPALISQNKRGQSGLWGYSISGDLPIVLVQIEDSSNLELVRQVIQAHQYWRLKGLTVDLVIWNEDHAGYRQILNDQIMGLLATGAQASLNGTPGGVYLRSSDQISVEDRILIQASARVILSDSRGTLEEQLNRSRSVRKSAPAFLPSRGIRNEHANVAVASNANLLFFNGHGGFSADGREYVINSSEGKVSPMPWVNVLANPHFGTVVSAGGSAYTWAENAHEFRLSPWHNDPIGDPSGECIYVRDEETGQFWMPMVPDKDKNQSLQVRHGFGYSVFTGDYNGIICEVTVFVALDDSVKFSLVKLKNHSGRQRHLSVTGYVEWVLGDLRSKTAMHLVTELDPSSSAILARNNYSMDFENRVAFFACDDNQASYGADRSEFLGRNGQLCCPAAMLKSHLSGRVGAALDPCAALQSQLSLADGTESELCFSLGLGSEKHHASRLVRKYRGPYAVHQALDKVKEHWTRQLGVVQVKTPDLALDLLVNGWLLYQTIAARLWARSGYYQSGGAFGFRDQLQDSLALVHAQPELLKQQILLCARHQFVEGDVQHWWHPPSGKGVRTRCSDDFLWLPLAVARYVNCTGDTSILDQELEFITGRQLNRDEESYYDLPASSGETASLYEHCQRALEHGKRYGVNGLPLMGSGDWNDGMNTVGDQGKGESVWLGFFLYKTLQDFADLAQMRNETNYASKCRAEATTIKNALEKNGWDGQWYRRAYFDNGQVLGSAKNSECRIDSIAQSWAVLSQAAEPKRSKQAMQSLDTHLVDRDKGIVLLLDPPFDSSDLEPGYIKGYLPGVRENGGQYTHAAIWAAMAFAQSNDSQRAWELANMINPIRHSLDAEQVDRYQVEPYVMAADVYGVQPHTGRGGWTWYTGSAGWMYRLLLESLLGLRRTEKQLHLQPCLPADWDGFSLSYQYGQSTYQIEIKQDSLARKAHMSLDGKDQPGTAIDLIDDDSVHQVSIVVGGRPSP